MADFDLIGTGSQVVRTHAARDCDPPCPVHAPSDHPLRGAPLFWRSDAVGGIVSELHACNSPKSAVDEVTRFTFSVKVTIPTYEWLTANARHHWAEKAGRTKLLRLRAWHTCRRIYSGAGRTSPLGPRRPVTCTATIHYPANRRQDPANASPTVKALIDGCVDAGLLVDDDAEHLTRVSFERGEPTGRKGWYAVTLRFEEEA